MKKVVIIGSGSLATHLALTLHANGVLISQIYSRTSTNAEILADKVDCSYTSNISNLFSGADIYIYAINDNSLLKLLKKFELPNAIHIHTSGSLSISIFDGFAKMYGVLYPLQTFTKKRPVDFTNIPILIEACNTEIEKEIFDFAKLMSPKVYSITSEQRSKIHLAAVFACNFTNYMYDIAFDIVSKAGIGFEILQPLILETADKIKTLTPKEAQTGPAVRYDQNIIKKHLSLLNRSNDKKEIYNLLTKSINNRHTIKKEVKLSLWKRLSNKIDSFFSSI
ncbi:MAG: Rossmann-like and DUF2520 domain-containing protein [Bacteroidales bacterium]